jgi:hypothetical protein
LAKPPRKHHYLPEFYTRQWAASTGELIRFSQKPNDRFESRRVTPGAIGFEHDLYTIPNRPPEHAQQIESRILSRIDNAASIVLKMLLEGHIPTDHNLRSDWARFLMAFWYRAPDDLQATKESWEILAKQEAWFKEEDKDEVEAILMVNLPERFDNPRMGQIIINMVWQVIDTSLSDNELLTSDCPVIRSNGLAPPEGNYSIPISPTKLFTASWGGELLSRFLRQSPRQIARSANTLTVERAKRFVLARDERQRAFIEKHFGKKRIPSPMESIREKYMSEFGRETPHSAGT